MGTGLIGNAARDQGGNNTPPGPGHPNSYNGNSTAVAGGGNERPQSA